MNSSIGNPKALGFGAWAIGAWMYSMVPAGWFPVAQMNSSTLAGVATFAKIALLVAALASFLRGESWHGVFFMFWSAVWWGFNSTGAAGGYAAWYLIVVAVVSFLLWLAANRSGVGAAANLVSLGVWVVFLLWGLGGWFAHDILMVIGGYVGLITALIAFWATFGEIPGGKASEGQATSTVG